MSANIANWMVNGETGRSSNCMAAVALGSDKRSGWPSHPHDPADLNRCIKLVKAAPEVRNAFPRIADLSPQWRAIIEQWDKLVEMFHAEVGEDWSSNARSAPNTYHVMQKLLYPDDGKTAP